MVHAEERVDHPLTLGCRRLLRRQLDDEVREIVQRTTGYAEALEEEMLLFK